MFTSHNVYCWDKPFAKLMQYDSWMRASYATQMMNWKHCPILWLCLCVSEFGKTGFRLEHFWSQRRLTLTHRWHKNDLVQLKMQVHHCRHVDIPIFQLIKRFFINYSIMTFDCLFLGYTDSHAMHDIFCLNCFTLDNNHSSQFVTYLIISRVYR